MPQNTKKDLNESMTNGHFRAVALLNQIKESLFDMPAPDSDDLDWGHVGSLHHVICELQDIRNFISR